MRLSLLLLFAAMLGCSSIPRPSPSGEYAIPVVVDRPGLLVCKVFDTEANCLEVYTNKKYVIPIDIWNENYNHLFHRYLDSQVKEFLDHLNYLCDNGVHCKEADKQPLKDLEGFVYE